VHYDDGRTYGDVTLRKAIDGQRTFYSPAKKHVAHLGGFLRTNRGTLLFDRRLRAVSNLAHQGLFLKLLSMAWPYAHWGYFGCLREKGAGPFSIRALAEAIGQPKSSVARGLTALREAGLLRRVTVRGAEYWRIVDYEGWVGSSRELVSHTGTGSLVA
jgi:DNA-binding transcriptional ArsR family regulator